MREDLVIPAPEATAHLVGHQSAQEIFLHTYRSQSMPHSWLITGPRGIGKATLAFRMARLLLSQGFVPQSKTESEINLFETKPADEMVIQQLDSFDIPINHPIFRRIQELSHSDLRVLRCALNEKTGKLRTEITIDQIRGAVEFLHMTPGESFWRVLIVDSADELNSNAANALLKILEEPRPRTVIILISHAPGRLLPTIRSRCRKLSLEPLPTEIIATQLKGCGVKLDEAELTLCVALAEGSIGRALEFTRNSTGQDIFQSITQILSTWPSYDPTYLYRLGDKFAGKGGEDQFYAAVFLLNWWLSRFVRWGATRVFQGEELFSDEKTLMKRLIETANLDHWLLSLEKTTSLFDRVSSANLDRKQAWISAWLILTSHN